jgi:hypothetical protein
MFLSSFYLHQANPICMQQWRNEMQDDLASSGPNGSHRWALGSDRPDRATHPIYESTQTDKKGRFGSLIVGPAGWDALTSL